MRGTAAQPEASAVALKAWQMGIKVVAGTDAGYSDNNGRVALDRLNVAPRTGCQGAAGVACSMASDTAFPQSPQNNK